MFNVINIKDEKNISISILSGAVIAFFVMGFDFAYHFLKDDIWGAIIYFIGWVLTLVVIFGSYAQYKKMIKLQISIDEGIKKDEKNDN